MPERFPSPNQPSSPNRNPSLTVPFSGPMPLSASSEAEDTLAPSSASLLGDEPAPFDGQGAPAAPSPEASIAFTTPTLDLTAQSGPAERLSQTRLGSGVLPGPATDLDEEDEEDEEDDGVYLNHKPGFIDHRLELEAMIQSPEYQRAEELSKRLNMPTGRVLEFMTEEKEAFLKAVQVCDAREKAKARLQGLEKADR